MQELLYVFEVKSENRISLPKQLREALNITKEIFISLEIINDGNYIRISESPSSLSDIKVNVDYKGRIIIPSAVRKKFKIALGTKLIGFYLNNELFLQV